MKRSDKPKMPSLQEFLGIVDKSALLPQVDKCVECLNEEFGKLLAKMKEQGFRLQYAKRPSEESFLPRNLDDLLFHEEVMCLKVREEVVKQINEDNKNRDPLKVNLLFKESLNHFYLQLT